MYENIPRVDITHRKIARMCEVLRGQFSVLRMWDMTGIIPDSLHRNPRPYFIATHL
jgi:hypothetical protein